LRAVFIRLRDSADFSSFSASGTPDPLDAGDWFWAKAGDERTPQSAETTSRRIKGTPHPGDMPVKNPAKIREILETVKSRLSWNRTV
jgi:hypothetical protein